MSILISDLAPKLSSTMRTQEKFGNQIIGRTTRSWNAQSDTYGPTSLPQMNVKIPSVGFIDPLTVSFNGIVSFTQGWRLSKSLNSIIKRVTIRTQSGDVLLDTNEWNTISNALQDFSLSQTEQESTFAITQLCGTDAFREQIYTGIRFCFALNADIFRKPSLLPMHLLGGLDINFWLDDMASAFIKVDQAVVGGTYTVSNFEVSMDVLTVTPAVEAVYQQAYAADKLSFPLTTWTHVPFQSESMVDNFRIETVNSSNRAVIVVPRLVSRLLDPSVNSFERTAQSLKYVQFSIGSNLITRYHTDGGGCELMRELQKTLDWSNTGTVTPYNYHCQLQNLTAAQQAVKSSKFLIAQDLELSKLDESILSGSSRVPITMNLEYAAPIQRVQYDCFVLSDISLRCGASIGTRVFV